MSLETRLWVANHPRLIFQNRAAQRTDVLDQTNGLRTETIAALAYLLQRGHCIEITAMRRDHHDDTVLNPNAPYEGTHAHGWAFDGWPLRSPNPGDYLDADDPRLQCYLTDLSQAPFYFQTGLAGSAYTSRNMFAAGRGAFQDDGGDHVHFGAQ